MRKKVNSAEIIYKDVKGKIIRTEYRPGDILNETQLAEEYGVSRTPIREVLHRLQYDGLIKIFPKIGAQVVQLDLQYLKKSFDVKKVLDGLSVRLAVENATPEDIAALREIIVEFKAHFGDQNKLSEIDHKFHHKVSLIADNPVLDEASEKVLMQLNRLWYYVAGGMLLFEEFHEDFVQIVDAIERKDSETAQKVAVAHVDKYNIRLRGALI